MKRHIFLSITEKCNLNCVYCFEKSKRTEVMTVDKAIEIIEKEMQDTSINELNIDFMGGEPFLEFKRIKEICEYVWAREWPIKYKFTAATNGTLVHGEIQEWLAEHKTDFLCFLSIDGIREAHNVNRTNSYDKIDIEFFRKNWPNKKAKMLCSKESLCYLAESVIHLHKLGFPQIELKLAYSFDWRDNEEMEQLKKQYQILHDFYIENDDLLPATLLDIDMKQLNYRDKEIVKWCTCGIETCSYEMDGRTFPCRYFQDLVRYKKVKYEDIWKEDYASIQDKLKGKCRECLLRDVCRTCYAYNMDVCGDYGVKNNYSCMLTKISAYYSALIILDRHKKNSSNQVDSPVLENAKKVVEAFLCDKWYI